VLVSRSATLLETPLHQRLQHWPQLRAVAEQRQHIDLPRHRSRYLQYDQPLGAPAELDTRHIVVINHPHTLPFFKDASKLSGRLLGGWKISGVNQFQTGTPCGIGSNNDYGEVGSFGCGNEGQFWTLNSNVNILGQFNAGGGSTNQYFVFIIRTGAARAWTRLPPHSDALPVRRV
jgi:hypothetical protein